MSRTLRTGDLAFYDSLTASLVPCRVVSITEYSFGKRILLVTTAARGCYARGVQIDAPETRAVPRDAVYRPRGAVFPRILPYTVEG